MALSVIRITITLATMKGKALDQISEVTEGILQFTLVYLVRQEQGTMLALMQGPTVCHPAYHQLVMAFCTILWFSASLISNRVVVLGPPVKTCDSLAVWIQLRRRGKRKRKGRRKRGVGRGGGGEEGGRGRGGEGGRGDI